MADDTETETEAANLEEELSGPAETTPNDSADPPRLVEAKIPEDIRHKYDFLSYRNAAVILAEAWPNEFAELIDALRRFEITTTMIRTAGGNESDMPKLLSAQLRPAGWHETIIQGDLVVTLKWREEHGQKKGGKPNLVPKERILQRNRYLDGHKIDYVKNRVALDFEWNSKDQTFDRDLYAFSTFFLSGAIDVGVLLTRSAALNPAFQAMEPALKKDGTVETNNKGEPRPTASKYGPSTTWLGKLIPRLNAGRNGGCPILAIGIRPECISDWPPKAAP